MLQIYVIPFFQSIALKQIIRIHPVFYSVCLFLVTFFGLEGAKREYGYSFYVLYHFLFVFSKKKGLKRGIKIFFPQFDVYKNIINVLFSLIGVLLEVGDD